MSVLNVFNVHRLYPVIPPVFQMKASPGAPGDLKLEFFCRDRPARRAQRLSGGDCSSSIPAEYRRLLSALVKRFLPPQVGTHADGWQKPAA